MEITLDLDESNLNRANHFFSIYDFEAIIGDTSKKFYLGNKNPRVCRFCKKTGKEVKFKKDAHVLPQFMGNKNLLSYFECDECNALFSSYEDSVANYFGINRTFSQIKGQTGKVPKFKDPKTGLEVKLSDKIVEMSTIEGFDPIEIDTQNKKLKIKTIRHPYVPIHIPKILIKIGLSMLDESDVEDYEYARKFIKSSGSDIHFNNSKMLRILGYFIPGPPIFFSPFAHLYKKKPDKAEELYPTRQFILYYANYCLQIILPFAHSDEWLQGLKINQPIFPLLINNSHIERFGHYINLNLDFTSSEKKKGEEHEITFSFDRYTDTLFK